MLCEFFAAASKDLGRYGAAVRILLARAANDGTADFSTGCRLKVHHGWVRKFKILSKEWGAQQMEALHN